MRVKPRIGGHRVGFSNEVFLRDLSQLLGVSPVGVLGRETSLDLTDLKSARSSLLLRELFSKYDDGIPSPEKERETWKRFHAAESLCRESNECIPLVFKYDPFWIRTRARIRDVLRTFSWDECAVHFGHGPGSTTRLPKSRCAPAYKYSGKPETTSGNAALARAAIAVVPIWKQIVDVYREGPDDDIISIVRGNSIMTVPKSYKTDRTIAKEPDMNVYIQKGIGRVIRKRLKQVGINLNDQGINQRAAFIGSSTGSLATIDLSMASDTVSRGLVEFLLPNDWYWAVELARSPIGALPSGEVIHYQKFSSMGNGYTFELESLFFWAIAQEVCCRYTNEREMSISVYGDDIIIPVGFAEKLLIRLSQAGFKPNVTKTFISGPYRESCGKHYFSGDDITPFYVRKPVDNLSRLFLLHNNLFRWSCRTGVDASLILEKLRALAPAKWRKPRLPDGFGDGAFIGAVDELRLDSHPHGWECWQVEVLQLSSKELQDDLPAGQLVASLLANKRNVSSLELKRFNLDETLSGLPVKGGKVQTTKIVVPRFPTSFD